MSLGWNEIVALFTFLQLVFLATVAFKYKKGRLLSNRLLAAFMAANALLIAQFLFSSFGWSTHNRILILAGAGDSAYLLLMPLLYLYLQSLCYQDFQLKPVFLLHGAPFVVVLVLFLAQNLAGSQGIETLGLSGSQLGTINFWAHSAIQHLQILGYIGASLLLLRAYRRRLKSVYSSLESIDLSWCNLLLAGFAGMWSIDFTGWLFISLRPGFQPVPSILITLSLLVNLALALAMAYKGLLHAGSFSGILTPPKYAASTLGVDESAEILQRLLAFMNNEKPYLRPSVTIDDLARKLGVSAKHLSQVIHSRLNQSFYDLINAHRIEAAKERLSGDVQRALTVLAVAYDVGFNSKSVFNTAFKRHTGMTPKEYRQQALEVGPAEFPVARE